MKNFLEGIGKITESALNLPPTEETIREKELELELLKIKKDKGMAAKQTTLTEVKDEKEQKKKPEEKKDTKPKQIPMMAKDKIHYPVYLILPENDTRHTRLIHFNDGKESYYFLEYNGHVYKREEIKNFESKEKNQGLDGNLDRLSANIIFMDNHGNLEIGELEFTEKSKKTILDTDNLKMENRTYERIHKGNKVKFGLRPLDVIFTIAVLGVVMMLLFWATFDGIGKVLSVEGGGAHDAWVIQHTPITINLTKNQTGTGIGQKLDHI